MIDWQENSNKIFVHQLLLRIHVRVKWNETRKYIFLNSWVAGVDSFFATNFLYFSKIDIITKIQWQKCPKKKLGSSLCKVH